MLRLPDPLRLAVVALLLACLGLRCAGEEAVKLWTVEVVQSYPHDTGAFTQGLIYADGVFYESTGQYGESRLRKVEAASGNVLKEVALPDTVFGEGMTRFGGEFLVLTWRARKGFTFLETDGGFRQDAARAFIYTGEGWGLTHDGTSLIMSDGTARLRFLDPVSKTVLRQVDVTLDGEPLPLLNELEYFQGKVWANVWQTTYFVGIDPRTGQVTDKVTVDLDVLFPGSEGRSIGLGGDVLNGIAYDARDGRLFVTGKRWPRLFEVRLVAVQSPHATAP